MQDNTLNNFSGGMFRDALPSNAPSNTYITAVNAQTEDFDYNSFGLVNEPSNELCFAVPEGYKICGWGFIEERDEFLVFSYNEGTKISQIGIGNTKSCEYRILLEDKDDSRFLTKFCFTTGEKINPQFKHLRPCNDLWVYWSNNFTYYRLNLDGDFCDIKYDDIVLFDCKCPAVIDSFVIEGGSDLLDAGAYQFACQLIDDDENKTNWFQINNPVYLTSYDNKRGDKSDKAILIEIDNLPKSFPKVAIAVIKTVGGQKTAEVITKQYHSGRKLTYIYRGGSDKDEPIEIGEILSRKTGFIQGKDLIQRDGRLFLYNLKEEWNLDAQKYASKIKASFNAWGLPAKYAGELPTLPRGEVISLAAVYNYCDGTSSLGFHIPGRDSSPDDFKIVYPSAIDNCTECDQFKWQIDNTAFVEEEYCPKSIFAKSAEAMAKSEGTFIPERTIYRKIEKSKLQACKAEDGKVTLHLSGGNCAGSGGGCGSCGDSEICSDGECVQGNCPSLGIPCNQCAICNGSASSNECFDNTNPGAECEECQSSDAVVNAANVLRGLVSCPSGAECIDGLCADTNLPCEFCATCGGGDYFDVIKLASSIEYDENTTEALEVDDCPSGEPIYDEDKCRIIGYKPSKIAKGKFGYWESESKYPKTKDCDGNYLYGKLADQNIRHHLVPDESLIPFHYSKRKGVVCDEKPDNLEWTDTTVFIIGLEVCNVELPPNPPKPYCPYNPVSIYWQQIDPKERRVNARGLLTHTFIGAIGNKSYAVPKNGVNSLEYYDRYIDVTDFGGIPHFRGGTNNSAAVYNFHSPDTQFQKVPLTADRVFVPYEITGEGKRYGVYGEGEEPLNMWHTTSNVRGARQAINLNQYIETGERSVSKPGKCQKKVTIDYNVDGCEEEGVYITVTVGLLPQEIEFWEVTINGDHQTNFSSNIIIDDVAKTATTIDPQTITFTNLVVHTTEGCKYIVPKVEISIVDKNGLCERSQSVTIGSVDRTEDEYDYLGGVNRCLKGISYAPKDSIVDKENTFSYPLLNLKRESSVYLEMEGSPLTLQNSADRFLSDNKYNGRGNTANGTSDASFLGDTFCQSCPIYNASGHYGVLINDSPNQYGAIESAAYIPLGFNLTTEEVLCGAAERYGIGDSYVGLYSFRRSSFVTDKVRDEASQFPLNKEIMNLDLALLSFNIAWNDLLCKHDCSEIPSNCDPDNDRRKNIKLRDFGLTCWNGSDSFDGYTNADYYLPGTQNTLVHFWTESRVNLWKRQTGIADPYTYDFSKNYPVSKGAEVYYPKLKTIGLDPEFPKDTPWTLAWLSRIGIKWNSIALLKKYAVMFLKLLILFLLCFVSITLLRLAAIPVLLFWIFDGSWNFNVCKVLYKIFGYKQCFPRCFSKDANGNRTQHCKIADNDLLPFEDNYVGYNWDYNTLNTLETKIGMTDPYNTCICDVGEGNQIVYSGKQNPLSITDAYKNFLPNSYLHIPADRGKIQSLFSWNNNFFAQTSDMIINIATADGIINLNNGQALEVITQGGDLRTMPKELVSGVPEGYAGSRDPNAAINTQFGRFSVDREAKKIFKYTGSMPTEISNSGIRNFLKENLDLELLKQFPNYKLVDEVAGIGYRLGFDHRFNKLLFTKVDFKARVPEKLIMVDDYKFRSVLDSGELGVYVSFDDPKYFENKSFTLSYDPINNRWISFHTYFPDGYAWDRDHMFTIKEGGFWRHGDTYGNYQMFYGKYHPHAIEFSITKNGLHTAFTDMELDVDAHKYDGNNWVRGIKKTFNKGLFYNEKQSSGEIELKERDHTNVLESLKNDKDVSKIEWKNSSIRINDIKDKVVDDTSTIFDGYSENGLANVNEENIGVVKDNFEGRYIVARLILDDYETKDIKHMTKRVLTQVDINNI